MINCYTIPTVIAKVVKHAVKHVIKHHSWRPIRRAVRHFPHHYLWHGVTVVCVGTGGVGFWQLLPPTVAQPLFAPVPQVIATNVAEPSTVFILGIAFLLILLVKAKVK